MLRLIFEIDVTLPKGGGWMTRKQQIEHIKARLKKAYSLPLSEQIKWKKEIQKLEAELARLQGNIAFDENKAFELLNQANKEILRICAEKRYGGDFYQFMRDNPAVTQYLDEALNAIDNTFKQKDMEGFKRAIEQYKAAFIKIEELYQQSRTMGFRELLPSEEKDFQISVFN